MTDLTERLRVEHHPERNGWQWLVLNETHACVAACASEDDARAYATADARFRVLTEALRRYAFHEGGCPVIAWMSDDTPSGPYKNGAHWPSHEAMVMDERCACGLRALLAPSGGER